MKENSTKYEHTLPGESVDLLSTMMGLLRQNEAVGKPYYPVFRTKNSVSCIHNELSSRYDVMEITVSMRIYALSLVVDE